MLLRIACNLKFTDYLFPEFFHLMVLDHYGLPLVTKTTERKLQIRENYSIGMKDMIMAFKKIIASS